MGIGNLGITEILIIAVVILLFFGPERIPEISRSLGQAMREFRRGVNEIRREIEDVERSVSDRDRGGRKDGSDGPARGRLEPGSPDDSPYRGPEHPAGAGTWTEEAPREEAPGEEAATGEAPGADGPGEDRGGDPAEGDAPVDASVDAATGAPRRAGAEAEGGGTSEDAPREGADADAGTGDGGVDAAVDADEEEGGTAAS